MLRVSKNQCLRHVKEGLRWRELGGVGDEERESWDEEEGKVMGKEGSNKLTEESKSINKSHIST